MSSVYTLEPPTTGKVILITNYGNIDIELWTKEAPRACRNFLQLCIEGYYNNCIFFRLIKDFMIQTGDPTNTGKGGESIWGKEFSDEFHSRLKFSHRGIVAMANKNTANTNSSQFFITVDKCPWLDKKHTIFGKITGDTFFNAMSICEIPAKDDFPITDTLPMIIRVDVLINPFIDIVPRNKKNKDQNTIDSKLIDKSLSKFKNQEKMRNTNLLSFDFEDENDYNNEDKVNAVHSFKIKPIHEIVKNDPKLINKPVIEETQTSTDNKLNNLKNKIKKICNLKKDKSSSSSESSSESEEENEENNYINTKESEMEFDLERKNEILKLKKDIVNIKKRLLNPLEEEEPEVETKTLTALQKHQAKFLNIKKGRISSKETMDKLDKFRDNLKIKKKEHGNWMSNKLKFQIDSQKAYAIQETKEKQMKSFDYNPAFK